MKFAHIADCHLGSWRQPEMQELNLEAFKSAIDKCIEEKVNFVIIAGDLFDSALPPIDVLKEATGKIRQLKDKGIDCYVVPGSHDFSITGKSMVSVLEKAGICVNLADKEIIKEFNGITFALFGVAGKKGSIEQQEISELKQRIEQKVSEIKNQKNNVFSILVLHTTVAELLNERLKEKLRSLSIKDLPQGFNYYALGHIHQAALSKTSSGFISYPGPLFPNNFPELEYQKQGSFLIVETGGDFSEKNIRKIKIQPREIVNLRVGADNETPQSLRSKVQKILEKRKRELRGSVLTLRLFGSLASGRPSEIDFASIEREARRCGSHVLLRNTAKLTSKEFEIPETTLSSEAKSVEDIEQEIIKKLVKEKDKLMFKDLLRIFNIEKAEGETTTTFTSRLTKDAISALNLKEIWGHGGENDN